LVGGPDPADARKLSRG